MAGAWATICMAQPGERRNENGGGAAADATQAHPRAITVNRIFNNARKGTNG